MGPLLRRGLERAPIHGALFLIGAWSDDDDDDDGDGDGDGDGDDDDSSFYREHFQVYLNGSVMHLS